MVLSYFSRFDETRKEKDMRLLAQQLIDGEKELAANIHEDPKIFKVTYFSSMASTPINIHWIRTSSQPNLKIIIVSKSWLSKIGWVFTF